jgi:hypothetical protein
MRVAGRRRVRIGLVLTADGAILVVASCMWAVITGGVVPPPPLSNATARFR